MRTLSTMSVIGAASIALLLSACSKDTHDDSAAPSTSTSSASSTTTSTSDTTTASAISLAGTPIEGTFFPICQHGSSGLTLVGLVDITDENNSALGSLGDDGSVVSVGIGKAANDDSLWQAFPSLGTGSANVNKVGELTFEFTGEAVNQETQEKAPFAVTVVCDRIEEK